MFRHAFVLDSDPSDPQFLEEANEIIEGLVLELDSPYLHTRSQQKSPTVVMHTWAEQVEEGGAVILVIDDFEMPARWVSIQAPTEEKKDSIVEYLGMMFPVLKPEQLREEVALKPNDPSVLPRLALSLNRAVDDESFRLIVKGLEHSDPELRISAATAARVLRSSRFVPALKAAQAKATENDERKVITFALEGCEGPERYS